MKTVRLAPGEKEDGVEAPTFTAKVWEQSPGIYLATPTRGPGAGTFYGTGETEAEALDDLAEGMIEKGYA